MNAIRPDDVRKIRVNNPSNLTNFLGNVVLKLRAVLFKANENENFQCTRNCLRLLDRILPVVFEDPQLTNSLFWEERELPIKSKDNPNETNKILLGPLLVETLLDLFFLPNFTFLLNPMEMKETISAFPSIEEGLLSNNSKLLASVRSSPKYVVADRAEVLLCMITLFSSALYEKYADEHPSRHKFFNPPIGAQPQKGSNSKFYYGEEGGEGAVYSPRKNMWVEHLVKMEGVKIRAFFGILVYCGVSYDPIGWGIPYNHIWVSDPHEQQMERSLQLLGILLEYRQSPLVANRAPLNAEKNASQDTVQLKNTLAEHLANLSHPDDLSLLWNGIITILNNPLIATNTYLPYSTKLTSARQEMLIFLWHNLMISKNFLEWGIKHNKLMDITYPIIYYLHEGRKDQPQLGMVHLGIFILFYLSGYREFAVALNTPFNKVPRFTSQNHYVTFSDFLISSLILIICDSHERIHPLRECCLTILANITPYTKTLSLITANNLLKLFTLITKPKFLFSNEQNYRCCFFLLESFNNILQYQFSGNMNVVYAIIKNNTAFTELQKLKIEDEVSVEEVDKNKKDVEMKQEIKPIVTIENADPPNPQTQTQNLDSSQNQTQNQNELQTNVTVTENHQEILQQPKFAPTKEWLNSWKSHLPIVTVIRFLKAIIPQIQDNVTKNLEDQDKILEFLQNTTVVGLLPLPHPIILRRFWPTLFALNWFHCYMWGVVFLKNAGSGIAFLGTAIKLFTVNLQ
eukprot:TRINITY_DN13387_c0_g2_i1.p1 TRINITY_DN13387_c0_g2~~TRINITY_DN13387_c0_g2_i1.p1  ORF type:complete len:796 (+),score=170.98 TRINITY_DN13387_c0_g2_i1:160-2388(+)